MDRTALHCTFLVYSFANPHMGLDLEYTDRSETDEIDEINEIEWIETADGDKAQDKEGLDTRGSC